MSRLFKILALLVGAAVALVLVAAVFFVLFFDANDFREEISSTVSKQTGREFEIEGDVSLSLFPWLAIELGKTRLGNAPGFGDEPFAEFERAKLSVKLLPMLLRREVSVDTVELDALKLNLEVSPRGVSNWDDLLADDEAETQTSGEKGSAIEISGVDVSNTTIVYKDRQAGDTYRLTDVNMQMGRVTGDGSQVPAKGTFSFDAQPTAISGNVELDTVLAFDIESYLVQFDGFSLEGMVDGLAASSTRMEFKTDGIDVQTDKEVVTMQPVALTVLGIDIEAEVEPFSYSDEVLPVAMFRTDAFSPKSLMSLMEIEVPETADPSALSRLTVDAKAVVKTKAIDLAGVTLVMDDTTFTGKLSVPRSDTGAYGFDLSADSIDLDRYMEPGDGEAGEGDAESVPVEIPADLIRPLNARGNLKVQKAMLSGMQFDNVVLGLNSANGRMRIHPVTANLFGGTYSGDVNIDARATPVLSVNEKIEGVDLAELARAMFEQDNITGTINGGFRLTGRGDDMTAVQQSLDGNMSFTLSDGTFEGTDIWYELRRARALLKGGTPPTPELPARTRFSSVSATGVVTDGVMRNNDLAAELPFMQLTGGGSVDLVAATVDYNLTARVFERPEALQEVSEEELADFTKAVIPMKITGPLASPSVKPDVGKMLRQRVEEEVKDRLLDKLFGGKDEPADEGDAPAEGEASAEGEAEADTANETVEEPTEESAEDELKRKLKGLFD
ncbi:MAG: AsmA family protein [Gammaproteobacteria bacterium]|nr:AsmA family protein [Gammaproteobacteria bacterium]